MKRFMTLVICLACAPAFAQRPNTGGGFGLAQPPVRGDADDTSSAARPQVTGGSGLAAPTTNRLSDEPKQKPGNPFKIPTNPGTGPGGMGGMMGMMGGMEEDMDMGMGMDIADFDEGYGGYGGMGGSFDPEEFFRRALQRAIRGLRKAESDEDRTIIKGYIKTALEERYARMIKQRREDLESLKAKIAKLEQDLKRRESAAKRVIEVQMQSVELASEGLLELGELRSVESRGGMGMMEMGGMDEMGGMMGAGGN